MPKFKHPETGNVIEVDEQHAEQVLRKQRFYQEVEDKEVKSNGKQKKVSVSNRSAEVESESEQAS